MAPHTRVSFLEQQFNHVALPRNVPGQEDGNLRRIDAALLTRLIDATSSLYMHALPEDQRHVRALHETLLTCRSLNVDGTVSRSALLRELRNFTPHKMLIIHASAQNCALLVYEHSR